MSNLEKSIINTVVYFDIFDYPLTLLEIWQWLYGESVDNNYSLADVQAILQNSEKLKDIIETQQGFYFLTGRQHIIRTRLTRYNIAEEKFWRAKWAVKLLSRLPFVKLIAVCNTLGYSNTRDDGDIDFFIIGAKNHLWLVRFLTTGLMQFLGWRHEINKTKNKICLSFFISDDCLDIQQIALTPQDVYLNFWLTNLVPLYDEQNYYQHFLITNKKLSDNLLNNNFYLTNRRRMAKKLAGRLKKIVEIIIVYLGGAWLERLLRGLQLKLMPKQLTEIMNQDTRVVVNDKMLKFHNNDRRAMYQELWNRQLANVLSESTN